MSALTRYPVESEPITVADVRYREACVALATLGTALAIIGLAYAVGLLVGLLS